MLTPTTSVLGMEPLNHQSLQYLIFFCYRFYLQSSALGFLDTITGSRKESYAMSFLGITRTLIQPINHPNYNRPHVRSSLRHSVTARNYTIASFLR